jgi:hypothetical protein
MHDARCKAIFLSEQQSNLSMVNSEHSKGERRKNRLVIMNM